MGGASEPERFVVLGSNSFSGSSFVAHVLEADPSARVTGVSRSPEPPPELRPYRDLAAHRFHFHQLDLNRDLGAIVRVIEHERPHYLVNFAAQSMVGQSWSHPGDWFRTNALATLALVDALKALPGLRRFVQVSTPEVYGHCPRFIDESAPLNPSTPYAASKAAGDLGMLPYHKTFGFPVVYTRAANVYGPHQQLYRIIPRSVLRILQGRRIPLHGGGQARRWFIHIRDVCRATLEIARRGRSGEAYHIAPEGEGIRIADLVRRLSELLGQRFEDCVEAVGERVGQDGAYALDAGKLRREFGWRPAIPLEAGLREVVGWIEKHQALLEELPEEYVHKP
jgi:dTDP-glucose 4,6-dehydratase